MNPRRSRFNRIYHRLTRHRPDRRAQWQQIGRSQPSQLRAESRYVTENLVYTPSSSRMGAVRVRPSIAIWTGDEPPRATSFDADHLEPQLTQAGNVGVAAMVVALFLLACGYAAFSGYTRVYNDRFAWLGVIGAMATLLVAVVGVSLAAAGRRCGVKILAFGTVSLAIMYGMLLFAAAE